MTAVPVHRHVHDAKAGKRDPTRTSDIRRIWRGELERRIATLKNYVRGAILQTDFLELSVAPWASRAGINPRLDTKIKVFADWFKSINDKIVFGDDGGWTRPYVGNAYLRGHQHAAQRLKEQLPMMIDSAKLSALQMITINDIDGITDVAEQQVVRVVAEALKNKHSPQLLMREVNQRIDVIERARGRTWVNSIVIGAYTEGTLDAYRLIGVQQVGIIPEFVSSNKLRVKDAEVALITAGDDEVCEECFELEGTIYELEDAYGVIPVHPNCRCAWIPIEDKRFKKIRVGEEDFD